MSRRDRVAYTPVAPDRKPVGAAFDGSRERAVLASPPTRTEAQREAVEAGRRQDELDAARGVARWSMRDAHGCLGAGCRKYAHFGDREVRDLLLDVLGIPVGTEIGVER